MWEMHEEVNVKLVDNKGGSLFHIGFVKEAR